MVWQKGKSGNPGGKTKDVILSNTLRIAVRRGVEYEKDAETGRMKIKSALPKKHNFADLAINTLLREAVSGNIAAIREMFNRLEGTPDAELTVVADPRTSENAASLQEAVNWLRATIARENDTVPSDTSVH